MSKRLKRKFGPMLPAFQVESGWEFEGVSLREGKARTILDDLPLFAQPPSIVDADIIRDRLVDKPVPCMSFELDRETRTMCLMDLFADKINANQNWLEIKFKDRIKINSGRVPYFEILSVLVGSVITMDASAGSLSMSNLRVRDENDIKYWNFVLHMAKELGAVWRETPLGNFYFKFRNQYELKARDTIELHTMKVGGAGSYRIVGMTAKRVK